MKNTTKAVNEIGLPLLPRIRFCSSIFQLFCVGTINNNSIKQVYVVKCQHFHVHCVNICFNKRREMLQKKLCCSFVILL